MQRASENGKTRYEFDFAISFARPQRGIAAELAQHLTSRGYRVFYDASFRSRLLGRRLDREFRGVFGTDTLFFVPIVSKEYADRAWPQLEWSVAKKEARKRRREFILPLRADDTVLLGLPETVGYIDLRKLTVEEVADILASKLPFGDKEAPTRSAPTHWVATFGLLVADLLETGGLPPDVPTFYPYLCDWLEDDLVRRLRAARVGGPRITEDSRDGETLSVRVSFRWVPGRRPLTFGDLGWWDVLEVLPFDALYGNEETSGGS